MTMNMNSFGGIQRMTDDEFDREHANMHNEVAIEEGTTPRPGIDADELIARQTEAANAKQIWSFSKAAAAAAASAKRRHSPKARTHYYMTNVQVNRAFDKLQKQITDTPSMMTEADFKLLKQAISNFRVRLIVHDSKTYEEIKQLQAETKIQEEIAERAIRETSPPTVPSSAAGGGVPPGHDNAADNTDDKLLIEKEEKHSRYLDLKAWNAELTKELRRIEPKVKYSNIGGGLFRYNLSKTDPPGVPSQHAHIAPATAAVLRNILTPETIRRTFISLDALTQKIRQEVVEFLTDVQRHKDRHEVIRQIKEACVLAAFKKQKM